MLADGLSITWRNHDSARIIVRASGAAPARRLRRNGGKAPAKAILRPIAPGTKRGALLAFFLRDPAPAIADAMRELRMSRENIFAHWTALHRDHGVGYSFDAASGALAVRLPKSAAEADLWH